MWAALRRDRLFDHATSTITLAAAALPEFVVAIALIILFATVVSAGAAAGVAGGAGHQRVVAPHAYWCFRWQR